MNGRATWNLTFGDAADLWFDAKAGMFTMSPPFLSKFSWKGRGRCSIASEPATNIEDLKQLA